MYKVKANWLLDKVSPWSYDNNYLQENGALEEFSLSKLKDCLAQIKVGSVSLFTHWTKKSSDFAIRKEN